MINIFYFQLIKIIDKFSPGRLLPRGRSAPSQGSSTLQAPCENVENVVIPYFFFINSLDWSNA